MSARSVVVALVATTTVVFAGCVPDRAPRMAAGDCAVVLAQLVEARVRRGPPADLPLSGSLRVPVGEIGDWVVRTPVDGVFLIDDGRPAAVCGERNRPERPFPWTPPEGTPLFTDADLRALVRRHGAGVAVYVWSPHMPLSVDGYSEMVAAAEERGVAVVPLLFAESDRDFARREAARVGMPESALRTLASVELLLRDAQVHAPSVIVFRGHEASPVMPGYRNAEGYGRWLDASLSRRDPPSGRGP